MGLFEIILPFSINSFLILATISLLTWYYLRNKLSYWSTRNIPFLSPATCLLNSIKFALGLQQFMLGFDVLYKKLEGHKYGGTFQFINPVLLLRDPEVIKLALVKGFSNFHDRGPPPNESYDPLSGNLFQLTGEKWHQVRRKLSPGFSNTSLKTMYQSLQKCAKEMDIHLQKLCSNTGSTEINVKEQMSNYTLDVIGACALGMECDAIRNPDSEFKKVLMSAFESTFGRAIVVYLTLIHPKIPQILGLRPRPAELDDFLRAVCRDAIELKEKDLSSKRKDFLQILMNSRSDEIEKGSETIENSKVDLESTEESEGPVFTENVLLGVVSLFIFAGFDPVAAVLTFSLYELALQPEIQNKVFEEIQAVKNGTSEEISYEDLRKMTYTDRVIDETLRKYPIAGVLLRVCTEPFKMPDSSLVVEKGTPVFIPVYSIHHDPQYFPDPEKFDPDRFSEANIHKIVPGTYLPFGDGPRFCIAMRLALLDIKTLVTRLVSNYTLHACPKTPQPMIYDPRNFNLFPKGELYLRLQKRK